MFKRVSAEGFGSDLLHLRPVCGRIGTGITAREGDDSHAVPLIVHLRHAVQHWLQRVLAGTRDSIANRIKRLRCWCPVVALQPVPNRESFY